MRLDISPTAEPGVSKTVYMTKDLERRVRVICRAVKSGKFSPVAAALLEEAVKLWEAENPELVEAFKDEPPED